MKVVVVNDQDEIIGYKDRKDRNPEDIIRISALWVFNSDNEVLIAQRVLSKAHDPGKWGPSAAGTVEHEETYISNIIKETEEELGIIVSEKDLIEGPHKFVQNSNRYFCQIYFLKVDLPISTFKIQKQEVEQVRWISVPELESWVESKPEDFIASFQDSFRNYIDFIH
jgi:isopentenyl-diphosphate Delta-isomerase